MNPFWIPDDLPPSIEEMRAERRALAIIDGIPPTEDVEQQILLSALVWGWLENPAEVAPILTAAEVDPERVLREVRRTGIWQEP